MKVNATLLALGSLLALAAAQATSDTTTSLSPQASCALSCGKTDTCCIAGCYQVPCPNDSMANQTNECVADCPQDKGADAYAACQDACFSSHFFPATWTGNAALPTNIAGAPATATLSGTGAAAGAGQAQATGGAVAQTGSSSSETGSGSGSGSKAGSSGSGSAAAGTGSATATGTGAASTSSEGAAVKVGASAAGLFGLVMAALAL